MAGQSDTNQITKTDAYEWFGLNSRKYTPQVILRELFDTTVLGKDYSTGSDYDGFDMSYLCRLYNITQYGKTRQANRIKNVFKKYRNNYSDEKIQEAFRTIIIYQYPQGIPDETPLFKDLLEKNLKAAEIPQPVKQQPSKNTNQKPVIREQIPNAFEQGAGEKKQMQDTYGFIGIGIVVMLVLAFVFRDRILSAIINLLPMVIAIGIFILIIHVLLNLFSKDSGKKKLNSGQGGKKAVETEKYTVRDQIELGLTGIFWGASAWALAIYNLFGEVIPGRICVIAGMIVGFLLARWRRKWMWLTLMVIPLVICAVEMAFLYG